MCLGAPPPRSMAVRGMEGVVLPLGNSKSQVPSQLRKSCAWFDFEMCAGWRQLGAHAAGVGPAKLEKQLDCLDSWLAAEELCCWSLTASGLGSGPLSWEAPMQR